MEDQTLLKSYIPLCNKNELIYTSCYCEENIWKLLNTLKHKLNDNGELFAVFISNRNRTIPIWYQSKSENIETPVVWDYHVIAIHKDHASSSYVYDLDTLLGFPETLENYFSKALQVLPNIHEKYKRIYRVIPAEYYLKNFASNRSHMIDKNTGEYMAQPPDYPCIQSNVSKNNIDEFISMELGPNQTELQTKHGILMNENSFGKFFRE